MTGAFQFGSIAGIPLRVHYTWLFAVLLIGWSLAGGFFPSLYPGWSDGAYWLAGILAAVGLFASVLVHELSHSLVALARGLQVHDITLFIFGGVSRIAQEAEEPRDELLISVVGPLTSFALAAIGWVVLQLTGGGRSFPAAILTYLVFINALLGAFNLLPGFPLDGGRVLRSIVWSVTGSLQRATTIASYVGQAFAFVLIFWGVLQLFGGNFLGGLWIAFIGWFLNSGAEASRQATRTRELLRGRTVSDVMATNPRTAAPDLDTRSFVLDYVMRQGVRALPVVDGGRLVGIVSITDAKDVPTDSWPVVPVSRIMTPAPLKTTTPGTDLSDVIQQIGEEGVHQLPVVESGQLVGMITRADILRYLQVTGEIRSASGRWHQRGGRDHEARRAA